MTGAGHSGAGRSLTATALIGPATFVAALGVIGPMLYLLRYSFNRFDPRLLMIDAFSLENYVKFFTDTYYLSAYYTTLWVAFICTAICLVLAFPLSYVLARTQSRYKNLMIIGVVVPLFVGNAVRAAGWMSFFGNRGLLNVTLMKIGIIDQPIEIMYTQFAVVVGIIAVNLPYMILSLQSVIESINRNVEEAAFSMGARPMQMFRRVLLPLALPGVAAGTILTFILAMNAYATPVLLGGPSFRMMSPLIYDQFRLNNWPGSAAIAFILMTTTLLLTILVGIITRQKFRA
ncbi:ABC transporter permease [Rhizobiaceae bacterium BDR2-2]|uniref:ABC transporter permease n=1 Tax=Ectorhizobium quercum TaxID=2965071 RepID=A0AAE3N128_9HYPH|nr:ABC transporter permease [Ectorhizobium quercum]MCX8997951.1 ABC transporter permease [Ectorhizobium quercum]